VVTEVSVGGGGGGGVDGVGTCKVAVLGVAIQNIDTVCGSQQF